MLHTGVNRDYNNDVNWQYIFPKTACVCMSWMSSWMYTGAVIVMQDVAPVLPVTSAAWCELRGRKLMVLSNSFQNRAAVMKRGTLPPKGEQCNSAVAFSCSHFDLEDKSPLYQKATNFTFLSCYWQSCKVAVVLGFSTTHCPFACPGPACVNECFSDACLIWLQWLASH